MVGTQEYPLFPTESKILRGREGINLLVHACRSNFLSFFFPSFLIFQFFIFFIFYFFYFIFLSLILVSYFLVFKFPILWCLLLLFFLYTVLRSKKDHSKGGPKEWVRPKRGKDQAKSKVVDAGEPRRNKKAQETWSPDEEASRRKKKTTARDKKSGSSATIKRRGSFQAQSQRKTRTAWKKKTEEKNKKQSKRTQAPVKPNDLSWHRQKKNLGEPEQRNTKREW